MIGSPGRKCLASQRGYAVFLLPGEPIFQIDASFMNQTSASNESAELASVCTTYASSAILLRAPVTAT
jgi:hypothetical protein